MSRGMEGQLFLGMSNVSQHLAFLVYLHFLVGTISLSLVSTGFLTPVLSERIRTGKFQNYLILFLFLSL